MKPMLVLLRGGGDLASGAALRLQRAGLRVLVTELPRPQVVRRLVSFAEAVYRGEFQVEGVQARLADGLPEALAVLERGEIPVVVDPRAAILPALRDIYPKVVLVDGRMLKRDPGLGLEAADLVLGLGPGFTAGQDCHAVIETLRGHCLGRVIWHGQAERDTGVPESVVQRRAERVLRAPARGTLQAHAEIGARLQAGQPVAEVDGRKVLAPFAGVLRGLVYPGLEVEQGMKIGDLDPRDDPSYAFLVSDKALAIGGGVLEAIFARPELRPYLWG